MPAAAATPQGQRCVASVRRQVTRRPARAISTSPTALRPGRATDARRGPVATHPWCASACSRGRSCRPGTEAFPRARACPSRAPPGYGSNRSSAHSSSDNKELGGRAPGSASLSPAVRCFGPTHGGLARERPVAAVPSRPRRVPSSPRRLHHDQRIRAAGDDRCATRDRKSTRLNSSHVKISYADFCLKKKKKKKKKKIKNKKKKQNKNTKK